MELDKFMLAQSMAFLISVPPESNLAKLLKFCLATKARENTSGVELLKLTYELMENPSKLALWTHEVMGQDLDYSAEEWKALGEMGLKDVKMFMDNLWQELENVNL